MTIFTKNKKIILCLIILFIISFSLRIYKVGTIPSGVLIDEASYGYNAYSILETGKDEHGLTYPLVFKAFGDQKLPAYGYILVPFIKVFGLNNFAVRLPSVIAGSLLCLVIFFLLLKFRFKTKLAFIGGLITATSPWTIILSRFGYESNISLLFFTSGLLFTFIGYRKNRLILSILGGILFGLTWYSYVAYKFITSFIILSILFLFKKKKKKIINRAGIVVLIFFIITVSPLILKTFSEQATARFNQAGRSTSMGLVLDINEKRAFCSQKLPKLLCYMNSNKPLSYVKTYLIRYINLFSPDYLFLTGDKNNKYLNVDNFGLFSILLLPFYFIGLIYLFSCIIARKITKKELFIILGLIITPLPSLLVGDPQKVRLSALFPFCLILIMFGFSQIDSFIKKVVIKKIYYCGIVIFFVIFTLSFVINFFSIHVHKYEISYGTYIPKLMKYLGQQDKQTSIYIRSIPEGIMYYAYVNKINPLIYQKVVIRNKPDEIGFSHPTDLENIHITEKDIYRIYCEAKKNNIKTLYVEAENRLEISDKSKTIIRSENGVDTLGIVYNVNEIIFDDIDCKSILK